MKREILSEAALENRTETLIKARKLGLSITWFVTWLCNYKCPYCWERIDDFLYRKSLMRTNQIDPQNWANAFNSMHPSEIYFTGGEPTLYNRLPEVFGLIDSKTKFKITSNFGPSFSLEKYTPYILDKRFSVVGLSFHPSDIRLTDFLKKMDEALELGYNEACDLGIELVLYPDDIDYAPALIKYCSQNQVKLILDTYHDANGAYTLPELLKEKADEYQRQAEEINIRVMNSKIANDPDKGFSVNSILQEDEIVLYGAGKAGIDLERKIREKGYQNIRCFIDLFKGGKGTKVDGIEILTPEEARLKYPNARYIITVQRKTLIAEIAILLFSLGISKENIEVYEKKNAVVKNEFHRGKQAIWCPAGMATLHVDPNGEAYSCMRAMTNEKENSQSRSAIRMKLGNILESNQILVKEPIICKDSYRCSACDYQLLECAMTNYE